MINVKLTNVSVNYGGKPRNNQNRALTFWISDGVDENSTVEEIKNLINTKYSDKIILTKLSRIEIVK